MDFVFNEDDEFDVISLDLEGDGIEDYLVLGIFETRQYDYEYVALMPVRGIEEDMEDCPLYLYRYEESDNEELTLTQIEDDEEFEIVQVTFESLFVDE